MDDDGLESPSCTLRIDNDYPTRAVILAAGIGRRLKPFTLRTPKPLLRIGGHPLIKMTLQALAAARVTDTCIVVNHLAEQIIEYVSNRQDWGMTIKFAHQEKLLGTADALKSASKFLDQPCFVLAADYALPREMLLQLKRLYLSESADMVVSLKEIPGHEVPFRSKVRLDQSNNIVELLEKPGSDSESDTVAASLIYIVPPEISHFLTQTPLSRRGEFELPEVFNLMIKSGFTAKGLLQESPAEWSA